MSTLRTLAAFLGCLATACGGEAARGEPPLAESTPDAGVGVAGDAEASTPIASDSGSTEDAAQTRGPSFSVAPDELGIDRIGAPAGLSPSYALSLDSSGGSGAALLASIEGASASTWSATTATLPVRDDMAGRRYRMRAKIKTADATGAFLWFRVDGSVGWVLDNMANPTGRRLKGTHDWQDVELVLDVDDDATRFAFGSGLVGTGKVWVGAITFDEVGGDVATTPYFTGKF